MPAARHCRLGLIRRSASVFAAAAGAHAAEQARSGTSDKSPLVFDARIVGDANRTRFVADMTGAIDVAVFHAGRPLPGRRRHAGGPLRSRRRRRRQRQGPLFGLSLRPDFARQIADRPRRRPARSPSTNPSSCRRRTTSRPGWSSTSSRPPAKPSSRPTAPIGIRGTSRKRRSATGPRRAPDAKSDRFTVVLDPGHGGIDTGAKGQRRRGREGPHARIRRSPWRKAQGNGPL